jgi:hypothetical protein
MRVARGWRPGPRQNGVTVEDAGGRLLNTFRPPIGDGHDGKIFAVAMAPDGRWLVAATGFLSKGVAYVHIFNTANGSVTALLGPFESPIVDLIISADGRLLSGHALWWRTAYMGKGDPKHNEYWRSAEVPQS